jgi:hypothetical protein
LVWRVISAVIFGIVIFLDITSVALHDLALLDPEVFFYCELFQKRLP